MHAKKVSHKIIDNACSWMHAARRNALAEAVLAAVKRGVWGQSKNSADIDE